MSVSVCWWRCVAWLGGKVKRRRSVGGRNLVASVAGAVNERSLVCFVASRRRGRSSFRYVFVGAVDAFAFKMCETKGEREGGEGREGGAEIGVSLYVCVCVWQQVDEYTVVLVLNAVVALSVFCLTNCSCWELWREEVLFLSLLLLLLLLLLWFLSSLAFLVLLRRTVVQEVVAAPESNQSCEIQI